MNGPSVEAVDLSKSFGRLNALDGASFHYEGAGAIGYLGPNGAGKTTTLKLFTGLLRPSRGHAVIDGVDVAKDPKRALWNVGAIIESPEPYPSQTVREALAMIGELRGVPRIDIRERTRRLGEELDLPPLDQRTGKLSKGQKQRVCLAGALLAEPTVLFLDEPTNGLDPAERVVVRNLLVRLRREGRLILMSSHLLQEVTEICEEVIFVNRGRILLRDSVERIGARFRVTRLDVEFVRAVDAATLSCVPGVRHVEGLSPVRYRLEFDGTDGARASILEGCLKLAPVTSFSPSSLTLEDAYLKLIAPNGPPSGEGPPSLPPAPAPVPRSPVPVP